MQGHGRALHAAGLQGGEQGFVEVQGRGGCGHGAGPGCEDGLVALGVFGRVGMGDVGRQRHVAVLFQQVQRISRKAQVEQRILRAGTTQHLGIKAGGQAQPGARAR